MRIIFVFLTTLLTGCSVASIFTPQSENVSHSASITAVQNQQVHTFYDYQLTTPTGQILSISALPERITDADVILIGEWHTHSAIHRFQTDLLKQLNTQKANITLSMEQFSRDSQPVLNQYLAGEIGEQPFTKQANAWPNYESDYRPLIEYAKSNQLDVIAANAPKAIVQCIGRTGLEYLETLPVQQRRDIAETVDNSASEYKEKFMASLHHGTPEQTEKQYSAQISWDETMAESITNYLSQNPGKQVMHIAGKFHTEGGLGTATSILNRNPALNVVVITPVTQLQPSSPDYQLLVLDPPTRFVKPENRMEAYKALSQRNKDLKCD
ncbi:hypothetical protein F0249_14210 [Vibrio sp. 03-59-1]|uniref:ChaN family lipoprotein n=1 Tax=Vibrio sp. 03-59-1 TaxID=2607607 RepID=UPI0014933616|nr:ChaN family lipoprotein [Vibrio sp. 03-59-1]NOH84961.1 hypothetical protein [Vibrio sp. 03-59-1]